MANQVDKQDSWAGWIGFAAIMLAVIGIFHMVAGFVALFKEDVYTVAANNIWLFDYSQWGWIHIIGGLLAFGAAGSLAKGHLYGRTIAVLVAVASIITNMMFVPVYPIWSIMMVTIGVLVIWAVTIHGKDIKNA